MHPALSHRRIGAALMAGAVTVTTVALASQPTSASPEPVLIGGAEAVAASQAPTSVTLITGDQVLLSTTAEGTPSAIVRSDGDYYTRRVGDDLYVIPVKAEPALATDRLDLELFNVTGLVEQGYDDESTDSLPLIVEGSVPQTRGPSAVTPEVELESIDATAVSVDKDSAAAAYQQLVGRPARSAGTVEKVWLDAKVHGSDVDLDPGTGVAQTGAPEAWDLGYDGTGTTVAVLDTGYDSDHPDLAGRVIDAKDFTDSGSPEDAEGHGTHVASTVAGTGAADQSKRGMAPGAKLLIGKVLSFGGGQTSWIVGGMEWAVAQGADVVNMSLGSTVASDCTDPLAQAAEMLSRQTKTLFVIAAGNSGMRETVSSPGCAPSVLTVGAVDAEGGVAGFSSRGPVLGNHGVKPDIAGPGVSIIGASMGSPGGIHYRPMSGTSMATPHVAGAAAMVRQAHPDWTGQQVKAALVGSVKERAQDTVYDQGAGELSTLDAIQTPVTSDTSVQLATFDWPHGRAQEATKQVTYSNTSDRAVKLTLDLQDVTGADGGSVPEHLIRLEDHVVTVPAHGTATVPVEAHGNVGTLRDSAYGEIGGRIVGTGKVAGKRVRVTTAVGFWLSPKTVTVTLKAVNRDGVAATSGLLDITDMHQPSRSTFTINGADRVLTLRAGDYVVSSFIRTVNPDGTASFAYVGIPEARFTEDTTLTLDARDAQPITVQADRPMQIRSGSVGFERSWDDDRWYVANSVFATNNPTFYAAPTAKVRDGDFSFGSYLRGSDPAVPVKDSAYVYNLAFTDHDRVGSDQSHVVDDETMGSVTQH
jgi:subtilisin family serine protease